MYLYIKDDSTWYSFQEPTESQCEECFYGYLTIYHFDNIIQVVSEMIASKDAPLRLVEKYLELR